MGSGGHGNVAMVMDRSSRAVSIAHALLQARREYDGLFLFAMCNGNARETIHINKRAQPGMRSWLLLFCLARACADQVSVKFQIVSKHEAPLQQDAINKALASQGLVKPVAAKMALVDLNATIVPMQCTPGYYWESSKCVQCQCASLVTSAIATMWFEPLV
jgi:hypothetical protein